MTEKTTTPDPGGTLSLRQIQSGIFGLCVADAVGVPVEFRTRNELKEHPVTGMTGYSTYNQPPGTWSDDSSLTLCLLDSLSGGLDYTDIMKRFYDWYYHGAYTADGTVVDIGRTTMSALSKYAHGVPATDCGAKNPHDNGNGSLMRILPLAFYLYREYGPAVTRSPQAMEIIHTVSSLTHAHPISRMACGIYVAIACLLLDGVPLREAVREGIRQANEYYTRNPEYQTVLPAFQRILTTDIASVPEPEIKSLGYVVATLEAALWSLCTSSSYQETVLKAVNLGSDTDTVAAVAGGLAGIWYGYDAIPEDWRNRLRRHTYILELCETFAGTRPPESQA